MSNSVIIAAKNTLSYLLLLMLFLERLFGLSLLRNGRVILITALLQARLASLHNVHNRTVSRDTSTDFRLTDDRVKRLSVLQINVVIETQLRARRNVIHALSVELFDDAHSCLVLVGYSSYSRLGLHLTS